MSERNRIGIAVILLGITVVAILAVNAMQSAEINALEDRVADLEAAQLETLTLLDQMVETDDALARASVNHSTAIMANSDAINEAVEGLIYIIEVYREDHVESIAEIYQGHIIPLRAFHMESAD